MNYVCTVYQNHGLAARYGNIELVEFLIKTGVNPSTGTKLIKRLYIKLRPNCKNQLQSSRLSSKTAVIQMQGISGDRPHCGGPPF